MSRTFVRRLLWIAVTVCCMGSIASFAQNHNTIKTYQDGAFALGFTHIVNTPSGIFYYNADTGAGAVGRLDAATGEHATLKVYAPAHSPLGLRRSSARRAASCTTTGRPAPAQSAGSTEPAITRLSSCIQQAPSRPDSRGSSAHRAASSSTTDRRAREQWDGFSEATPGGSTEGQEFRFSCFEQEFLLNSWPSCEGSLGRLSFAQPTVPDADDIRLALRCYTASWIL